MNSTTVTQKQYIRYMLVAGLVAVSLGGWLLHLKIHPVSEDAEYFIPAISGILSVFIIPALFLYRKTIPYAYVISGITVIVGTVTMGHLSIVHLGEKGFTLYNVLFETLLADIAVLWTKLVLAKSIFELDLLQSAEQLKRTGRFFRYPNWGYWFVHLFAISTVYTLGHFLWR